MDSREEKPTSTWPEGAVEGDFDILRRRASRAWKEVGRGPRRAILLGFILSWVLWVPLVGVIWPNSRTYPFISRSDERDFAIILFPVFYWLLVFAGLWVYRGFKK